MHETRRHSQFHQRRQGIATKEAQEDVGLIYKAPSAVIQNQNVVIHERSATTSSSTCPAGDNSAACQKPEQDSNLPIILGAAIPICFALILFLFLHRRHQRKLKEEDKMDKTKSMDFGLDLPRNAVKRQSRGIKGEGIFEKSTGKHTNQHSLDMGLTAPYLMGPDFAKSHDSLASLGTAFPAEDPFHLANVSSIQLASRPGSRADSMSSFPRSQRQGPRNKRDSSVYTASIKHSDDNDSTDSISADLLGHSSRMAHTSPPARGASLAPQGDISELRFPEPATYKALQPIQTHERDSYLDNDSADLRRSHLHLAAHIPAAPSPRSSEIIDKGDRNHVKQPSLSLTHQNMGLPSNPRPMHQAQVSLDREATDNAVELPPNVRQSSDNGFVITPPSPSRFPSVPIINEMSLEDDHLPSFVVSDNANSANRNSNYGGLEVNHINQDTRRLSIGLRPLPPAAEPGDTPEERAMRIRSFYKEYFDESKDPNATSAFDYYAQMPEQEDYYYEDQGQDYTQDYSQEHGDYYDYSATYRQSYVGDDGTQVWDEHSQQYVGNGQSQRPFAEPPMRRAMTPPPRAPPRFQPPRSRAGSVGGHSMDGQPQQRSYSSQSGRTHGGPPLGARGRKAFPPAEPLQILPTPHLLKYDTAFSPISFAPAPRYKEQQQGTMSETGSVRGGIRPYSPSVRAHVPLASSFDELNALPTPSQLRKSGTFTGLDFAPPRKFNTDGGDGSDSGSIRSNRTGRSNVYGARTGAYRVSRIPAGVVPMKDDMMASLRPTWDVHGR